MAHAIPVQTHHAHPRKFYHHLYFQVLVAIAAGMLLGHFYPDLGASLKPLGDAFIKLVKMVIAPVIFLTVVTGIAGMSDLGKVGRVAGKAMIYFLTFSTLALIIGLVVANVVQPGAGFNIDPKSLDPKAVATYTAKAHDASIVNFLMDIIPATPVSALAAEFRILSSGLPYSPTPPSAIPNSTEKNSTCRISPAARADTGVAGMMSIRKLTMEASWALAV